MGLVESCQQFRSLMAEGLDVLHVTLITRKALGELGPQPSSSSPHRLGLPATEAFRQAGGTQSDL